MYTNSRKPVYLIRLKYEIIIVKNILNIDYLQMDFGC